MSIGMALAERGLVPTPLVRRAIRGLCAQRLREVQAAGGIERFLDQVAGSRIAEVPHLANAQHYEVPSDFFALVLGRNRKYSSAVWPAGVRSLDDAEDAMLALTCERAGIGDGQDILELGCGWGSLSRYMARRYPGSRITAVSNSASQGAFVRARAAARGLRNVEVVTADMNRFAPSDRFDRVVSVEMFEHMRNWPELLRRVRGWLEPAGRLFVHVFAHRRFAYPFAVDGDGDWMARHFFTGGMMPSHDLLGRAGGPFEVEARWLVPGTHYQRTAEAWLERLDAGWTRAVAALARVLPRGEAERQARRWRIFFLACAELFGFAGGEEWVVSHHRLAPVPEVRA
ncbi:MAG TPA: cyclopropane-fatty-acyl-phospholipid synthase family protein [Anaeromyxobacter sp.]